MKLLYRYDGESIRVWQDGWPDDRFEVIDHAKFEYIKTAVADLAVYGVTIEEAEDE